MPCWCRYNAIFFTFLFKQFHLICVNRKGCINQLKHFKNCSNIAIWHSLLNWMWSIVYNPKRIYLAGKYSRSINIIVSSEITSIWLNKFELPVNSNFQQISIRQDFYPHGGHLSKNVSRITKNTLSFNLYLEPFCFPKSPRGKL